MVEHLLHTQGVTGSSPAVSTNKSSLYQMIQAALFYPNRVHIFFYLRSIIFKLAVVKLCVNAV